MSYTVLSAQQADEWHSYLDRAVQSDIYFTPEYCRIYEENGDGNAQLFVYSHDNDFVCYPYLLRNISALPLIDSLQLNHDVFDITTPYGYGGLLTNVREPENKASLIRRFEDVFHEYCRVNHIVSEFVRFHPLIKSCDDYKAVDPSFVRNTIYIDLGVSEEEIQRRYSRDNRNRIRRALKEGLTVGFSNSGELTELLALYYSTMDKKQANPYYYFSEQFFNNTVGFLGDRIELVQVKHGDKVIASALFMVYGEFIHYHLMGSDKQFLPAAPVNLLLHFAVLQAKARGYRYLHLGGGYTGNDNLFRFKRSFNEQEMADFYVGKRVHCSSLYEAIVQQVDLHPAVQDFFPIYRHPELQQSKPSPSVPPILSKVR
jgi:hypothetical protein